MIVMTHFIYSTLFGMMIGILGLFSVALYEISNVQESLKEIQSQIVIVDNQQRDILRLNKKIINELMNGNGRRYQEEKTNE